MNRNKMHIGQKVRIPAKDIITWKGDDFHLKKKVHHQKEKILFVRELHDDKMAGLSYTMESLAKNSMGIFYEVIEPIKPQTK